MIEKEEDAISHTLGLNYGITPECIIEYLVLRNHYHTLCINLGCSASSGLRCGNATFVAGFCTFHPAVHWKSVCHTGPQVEIKCKCGICIYIGLGIPICLRVQREADVSLNSSCFVCRHCLQSEEAKHEMAAGGSGASF